MQKEIRDVYIGTHCEEELNCMLIAEFCSKLFCIVSMYLIHCTHCIHCKGIWMRLRIQLHEVFVVVNVLMPTWQCFMTTSELMFVSTLVWPNWLWSFPAHHGMHKSFVCLCGWAPTAVCTSCQEAQTWQHWCALSIYKKYGTIGPQHQYSPTVFMSLHLVMGSAYIVTSIHIYIPHSGKLNCTCPTHSPTTQPLGTHRGANN